MRCTKGSALPWSACSKEALSLQGQAGRDVVQWVSSYEAAEWRGCTAHTQLLRLVLAHVPTLKDGADEAKAFTHKQGCSAMVQILDNSLP